MSQHNTERNLTGHGRGALGAAALLLLFLSTAAAGASGVSPIRVELSRFTFGARVINRSWTPVQTRVRNDLESPVDLGVVIGIDVAGRAGEQVNYLRRITLPPRSSRTIESYVLIDIPPAALFPLLSMRTHKFAYTDGTVVESQKFTAKPLSINTRLLDAATGQEYEGSPLMGLPSHPQSRLVIIIDGQPEEYTTGETYDLRGQPFVLGEHNGDLAAFGGGQVLYSSVFSNANYPVNDDTPTAIDTTRISSHDLPGKWAAYEGVHGLILGSLRSHQGPAVLTPQQRHSLLRWVRSGGNLVVSPGANMDAYRHPFWEQLLPVRLLGTRFAGTELELLGTYFNKKLAFDSGFPPVIPEAVAGTGEVLISDGARVLLARRRVGNGNVWFMGIPGEAIKDWSSSPDFWRPVLKPVTTAVPGLKDAFANSAPLNLARIVGAAVPDKNIVVALLSAYVILGIGALIWCRRRGNAEYGWPVLMLLAVLGLACAMIIGVNARAKVGLAQGELGVTVLGLGDAQGSATSFVGIYSPKPLHTDVLWTNPDTLATAHPGSSEGDSGAAVLRSLTVDQSNHFVFPQVRLNPGELTVARAMTLVSYGSGVEMRVGFDSAGVTGFVENRTGKVLHDCILRLNRRTLALGRMEPGVRLELQGLPLTWDLTSAGSDGADRELAQLRRDLLAEILRIPQGDWFQREKEYSWPVAFYGWTDEIQAALSLDGDKTPDGRALHVLALPINELEAADEIFLPAGVCGLRLFGASSMQLFGHRRGGFSGADVRLPRVTRIAGMARENSAAVPRTVERVPFMTGTDATPDAGDYFKPLGWNSGTLPVTARVQFILPESLKGLRVKKLALITALEFKDLRGRVSLRRRGSREFTVLQELGLNSGRVETEILELEKYIGPGGELPEFEISFSRLAGNVSAQPGSWNIHEFDIKIWGQMPERVQP